MTKDQARIIILEDELASAYHSISFMHGCLTKEGYRYAYPDMTEKHLERIHKVIPERVDQRFCVHSMIQPAGRCEGCDAHLRYMGELMRAKAALGCTS